MFDFKAIQKLMPQPKEIKMKLKMTAPQGGPESLAALTKRAIVSQDKQESRGGSRNARIYY